jgi:hypothetical protein
MATKEKRREIRGAIEALEDRLNHGPPILPAELRAVEEWLSRHDFSPASDYFSRLRTLQSRLGRRHSSAMPAKRNYGGAAAGTRLQVQSVYDHIIVSTCYDGEFRTRRGRIKISHRFNEQGRIDFVELKFLTSLEPSLSGAFRKLLTIRDFQLIEKSWREAEAFVLATLPLELVFLHPEIFRQPREEVCAWLVNIGHNLLADVLKELETPGIRQSRSPQGSVASKPNLIAGSANGDESTRQPLQSEPASTSCGVLTAGSQPGVPAPSQLPLSTIAADPVAWAIMERAAALQTRVRVLDSKLVQVRYFAAA